MKYLFILIAACVVLSSCSSLNYPVVKKVEADEGEVTTYSVTSDVRLVHVIHKAGKTWFLTEPAPDAAFSYQNNENISISAVSTGGGKDAESVGSESTDLPMTGRAAYVVFSRELLFRLNEMAVNVGMSSEDYQKNYDKTLDIIKTIASLEAATIKQTHNIQANTKEDVENSASERETPVAKPPVKSE
jgi:hypothetical protein